MTWRALLMVLVMLWVTGCVARQGHFTVLSDRPVDTGNLDISGAERLGHVSGRDISHIIVFIPTNGRGSLEAAVHDALASAGGDVLVNASVYTYFWYIPHIYGQRGWWVEGDAVNTRSD